MLPNFIRDHIQRNDTFYINLRKNLPIIAIVGLIGI